MAEELILVSACPKKIRNGLAWDRIRASTVPDQEAKQQAIRVPRQNSACSDSLSESGVCRSPIGAVPKNYYWQIKTYS